MWTERSLAYHRFYASTVWRVCPTPSMRVLVPFLVSIFSFQCDISCIQPAYGARWRLHIHTYRENMFLIQAMCAVVFFFVVIFSSITFASAAALNILTFTIYKCCVCATVSGGQSLFMRRCSDTFAILRILMVAFLFNGMHFTLRDRNTRIATQWNALTFLWRGTHARMGRRAVRCVRFRLECSVCVRACVLEPDLTKCSGDDVFVSLFLITWWIDNRMIDPRRNDTQRLNDDRCASGGRFSSFYKLTSVLVLRV